MLCYTGEEPDSEDSENGALEPRVNKNPKSYPSSSNSSILALCTPIMRQAHLHVQLSHDIVFIDSTSAERIAECTALVVRNNEDSFLE